MSFFALSSHTKEHFLARVIIRYDSVDLFKGELGCAKLSLKSYKLKVKIEVGNIHMINKRSLPSSVYVLKHLGIHLQRLWAENSQYWVVFLDLLSEIQGCHPHCGDGGMHLPGIISINQCHTFIFQSNTFTPLKALAIFRLLCTELVI